MEAFRSCAHQPAVVLPCWPRSYPISRPPTMRVRKRDTTALAIGSAISGLLAYLVFALTIRAIGPETAAPVSVLWSYWSIAGAVFTFPLQHWITRSVTAHGEGAVRRHLPRLFLIVVLASLVLGALAWLGRGPLFHRDDLWFPSMVALVTLGSALIGVVRGGLSARGRFLGVAWSLIAENGLRCVGVGVLILFDVGTAVGFGLCLVAGHLVVGLWPSALRFRRSGSPVQRAKPFAFLTGAALAQVIGQSVLTSGPVVLALAGGSPTEVTALFAALALFRAPYILALGLVSQLTAKVTSLVIAGNSAALRRIRFTILGATAVSVVLAGGGGAWFGPILMQLVFGAGVSFGRGESAVVAIACTIAVANLVLMISLLAHDRPRAPTWSWIVALIAAAIGSVTLSGLPMLEQIVWCFLIAESVAFTALLFADRRVAIR